MDNNSVSIAEGESQEKYLSFIQRLVGQPIEYVYKHPQWCDLFEFGFGKWVANENHDALSDFAFGKWLNNHLEVHEDGKRTEYVIHTVCPIKVVWRKRNKRIEVIDEQTDSAILSNVAKHLTGQTIKRVGLSDKNDLWLDLDEVWIIIVTEEDDEESWRLFTADVKKPHLVASNSWIEFDE